MHGEELLVCCGKKTVKWSHIIHLLYFLERHDSRVKYKYYWTYLKLGDENSHRDASVILQGSANAVIQAKLHWHSQGLPFPDLLDRFKECHSTEILDKVYALLSLASNAEIIDIDYSLSAEELFLALVSSLILMQETRWSWAPSEHNFWPSILELRSQLSVDMVDRLLGELTAYALIFAEPEENVKACIQSIRRQLRSTEKSKASSDVTIKYKRGRKGRPTYANMISNAILMHGGSTYSG